MSEKNPDSIEKFLSTIPGLNLEGTVQHLQPAMPNSQPKTGPVFVRVMYSWPSEKSPPVLYCFVYNHGNSQDIPSEVEKANKEGRLEHWYATFKVESLRQFSEIAEEGLEQGEINSHRSTPLLPSAGETIVSYALLTRQDDTGGRQLYGKVRLLFTALYNATGGNLFNDTATG